MPKETGQNNEWHGECHTIVPIYPPPQNKMTSSKTKSAHLKWVKEKEEERGKKKEPIHGYNQEVAR